MGTVQYLGVGVVVFVFLGGCESTPTVTRTGDVTDIVIGNTLSAAEVSVSPGDEVRWVNRRTSPVQIVFLDSVTDDRLSCMDNIGGWLRRSNSARLDTNESASACFRYVGHVRYTVRMTSGDTPSEINVPGTITVGRKRSEAEAGNAVLP